MFNISAYELNQLLKWTLTSQVLVGLVNLAEGQDGPVLKIWNKNTNLNNMENWDGFERNCSKNIYSFPFDMDRTMVISISPNANISTKQIILPRNGHLVFQKGSTVWLNSPTDTCQGTELKFRRTLRSDWFDSSNWKIGDSLLSKNYEAIPHVERVPCQYDYVQFPSESSFHLLISSDVVVAKFFLGEEELDYMTIAILMTSQLGKIQFEKTSETQFSINNATWRDSDEFICKNYETTIRTKICSFARCRDVEHDCGNPILPHGFCCPICGYHLKIGHNGALALAGVKERVKSRLESLGPVGSVAAYVGRHGPKMAHIVFIPWTNTTKDVGKLIDEIRIFIQSDSSVLSTTLVKSFEDSSNSGLASGDGNAGVTTIIVLFVIFLVGVIGVLVFLWTKKYGYPPITITTIMSHLPPLPRMGGTGSGDSPRPSFSFARFSNERISNINIGATISGDIQRTEQVDGDTKPIEMNVPSAQVEEPVGFSNATYDLIEVLDSKESQPPHSTSSFKEEEEHIYDLVEINPESSAIFDGKLFEE